MTILLQSVDFDDPNKWIVTVAENGNLLVVIVLRGALIQEEPGTIGQVPWNSVHQEPFPAFRIVLADCAVS